MSVSVYSAIMAILWFTVAVLIASFTLRKASRNGLLFVAAILLLSVLRIFLPLDLEHSFIIRSARVYTFLQYQMRDVVVGQITLGVCFLIIWAAGSCIVFISWLRKLLYVRKFCNSPRSHTADQELLGLFREVSGELGYDGPVTLIISADATSAYQLGFIRPYIILPCDENFTVVDIRNMLRHELCHFLCGDSWLNAGIHIMVCLLWWNPAAFLLKRNVKQMMELRCDRLACMNLTELEQLSYLDTLLQIIALDHPEILRIAIGYSGTAEEADLTQRFQMIMNEKTEKASKVKTTLGCLLCVGLFIASYFVIVQPWVEVPMGKESNGIPVTVMEQKGSYIVCESDGTLNFYCNGVYCGELLRSNLDTDPFSELPIIYERIDSK